MANVACSHFVDVETHPWHLLTLSLSRSCKRSTLAGRLAVGPGLRLESTASRQLSWLEGSLKAVSRSDVRLLLFWGQGLGQVLPFCFAPGLRAPASAPLPRCLRGCPKSPDRPITRSSRGKSSAGDLAESPQDTAVCPPAPAGSLTNQSLSVSFPSPSLAPGE